MNKSGEKNGYDQWGTCQGCGHEHWLALIVKDWPLTREGTSWQCHSCVFGHDCSVEIAREVVAAR